MDWNEYTRLYGRHSNIPDCCIEAFIKDKAVPNRLLKYAQCCECINAGRGVEIHFCTPECIPFLQSIGMELAAAEMLISLNPIGG